MSCAIKNCEFFEYFIPEAVFQFPMKDPLPIDNRGFIHVPDKPGLGVELDWEAIDKHCAAYKKIEAK